MSHPLNGVALKLERAHKHIIQLNGELTHFKRLYPDSFGTNLDPNTGRFTHAAFKTSEHDIDTDRLAIIAGEALHQMRSALDHLIARMLMGIPANVANIDAILEDSFFPICTKPISFQSFDWSKIPGISSAARQAISDHQPCNRKDGLPPEDHPLAVLTSLNNIDKHRMCIKIVRPTRITRIDLGPQFQGSITRVDSAVLGSSQAQAVLMEGSVPPGTPVDMQIYGTSDIVFKDVGTRKREPIIPTLERLLDYVGNLVNDFGTRFF
jgi:hypothetical protein